MDARLSVIKTIEKHGLIKAGDRIVLGLSGGPDSLCLMDILAGLQEKYGFSLSCLHLNHMIRGRDADEDAAWLTDYCSRAGVPLTVVRMDIPEMARLAKAGLEETGRTARRSVLLEQAAKYPGGKVALAHNMDDQAETVLMRILRGSGVKGLGGMQISSGNVIRPLLETTREDIEEYIKRKGLSPRIDSSNYDTAYTRNKIRLDLIPYLQENFNPNIKETLVRLSENAAESGVLEEAIASDFLEKHSKTAGQCLSVERRAAKALPSAALKRALAAAFAKLGLTQDIAAAHLESLTQAIKAEPSGKLIELPHGYTARICRSEIILEKKRS